MGIARHAWMTGAACVIGLVAACASMQTESAYAAQLPASIRPSYDLFAQRCSKCHGLSRPLDSGIDDDDYWALYVRRMRLQPGSGISARDESIILEFLRYYARERRERKRAPADARPAAPAPADAGAAQVVAPPPVVAPAEPMSSGDASAPSGPDASSTGDP